MRPGAVKAELKKESIVMQKGRELSMEKAVYRGARAEAAAAVAYFMGGLTHCLVTCA